MSICFNNTEKGSKIAIFFWTFCGDGKVLTLEGFMTDFHSVQNPGSVSSYFCRFLQPINMLLSIQQSMMFYANH